MTDLSRFPITRKWPPQHPDRLQLYSLPTPNGVKVSIMLEETGLPYEPHLVSFDRNDQLSPEFLSLNPNNKIPAILDPQGPGGQPLALFESGAILVYLAEKTGQLMPRDAARRYEALQWLMFQMSGIGPMFGQVGFFHKFAGKDYEDKRPRDRYVAESRRLLKVLEQRLFDRRHRHLPLGAQPHRLLWRGRSGGRPGLPEREAGTRGVRRTAGGGAGPRHPQARVRRPGVALSPSAHGRAGVVDVAAVRHAHRIYAARSRVTMPGDTSVAQVPAHRSPR
jgi:GST-like protein